jgi:hypothetical protein
MDNLEFVRAIAESFEVHDVEEGVYCFYCGANYYRQADYGKRAKHSLDCLHVKARNLLNPEKLSTLDWDV